MYKTYLYLALTWLCALPLCAGKLTVVIAIDGLDATSLAEMQPYWQRGGLRTMTEQGTQTNADFDHWLYGGEESLVTLLTATPPAVHGICADYVFSKETRTCQPVFQSTNQWGIGTLDSYSGEAICTMTITDKHRLTHPDARVYAVGIHPATTVALAGHAASACCWMGKNNTNDSLHWVSTSFYEEGLPHAADVMNIDGSFSRIARRIWVPRMEIGAYNHPTTDERQQLFSYQGQDILTSSPMANALVTELAVNMQKDKQLGQQQSHDLLLLEMTALTPKAQQATIASAEQEDMYMSLNQDIGYLMEQFAKHITADNLQFVVLGVPRIDANNTQRSKLNIPMRSFNVDRAVALTSTYLMALYGRERWLDGACGQTLFFNRALIEQKQLSLFTLRQQVAEFLMQFEGVQWAYPIQDAISNATLAPSMHKRFAGDVVFTLQPFYRLVRMGYSSAGEEKEIVVDAIMDDQLRTPVLIWPAKEEQIPQQIHATQVANWIL